ncbi:ribosome maturation factor RimP [Schaalia hyovaginalis]|uniref:ribosome maturation factor RimP n=1 Tax=Schaalia TaxID=2529408 RepID=UPI0026EDD600|nr:ribosome maturation factor RimP [Schaalia hyovaginalis]MCI6410364.1 ribosome maturation factor RimP [Schaalia hyovaginalis]MCI6557909.1 ribosome maturation factor RimP [Schaalia hyovaginalis]MCI7513850.1 ribosome maturation factor RimP [Schaalia hyovaginalis]MDY3093817.1 ribosome maturation factor RimP [Schaalia hyovaginalis]MDY3665377.1 ribosome maturation factor RimP [Schaalia hyovaginalis]
MSHAQRLDALEKRLRPVVEGFGLELDAVVSLSESGMKIVRVTVEAPEPGESVDSDLLGDVSRAVSPLVDEADPIETEYFLEVSTPGAERELTEPRHWRKQIGRPARVKLRDGSVITGKVMFADDEGAELDVDGTTTRIEFAQMKKARARVEFGSEE